MNRRRAVVVLSVLSWCLGIGAGVRADDDVDFNRDVRPILSEFCFACHGPDKQARKADLRLDTEAGLTKSGILVAGRPAKSKLVQRIESDDPEQQMPPPEVKKRPDAGQRVVLARWIRAGARWEQHWAFVTPRRPPVPGNLGHAAWARTPIDFFVGRGLDRRRLQPNPTADRSTLARRVALHLTGLPPHPETSVEFLADKRPGAFQRLVDRLLASPAAAEHRTRFWLDAARYGDTHGMHLDNYREIWPYRDWVIGAFASNMPFDRFVVEQIAGDLLPRATLDQRIATGFGRCNVSTAEGGLIPEEMNVRYMVDRVETVSTVFMGLTARCAGCHDHKYDPLKQRDFYRLAAFFNNTTQPPNDGNQKDSPPVAVLPSGEYEDEWNRLRLRRGSLLAQRKQRPTADVRTWWKTTAEPSADVVSASDLIFSDSLVRPLDRDAEAADWPEGIRPARSHPGGARGVRFADEAKGLQRPLKGLTTDRAISISFWLRTPEKLVSTTILEHRHTADDKKTSGWKITSNPRGSLSFELADGKGGSIKGLLPGDQALAPSAWQHVCVRYSGGRSNSSISMLVDGQVRRLRNANESLVEAAGLHDGPLVIGSSLPTGGISDVRVWSRWLSDDEARLLSAEFRIRGLASDKPDWKSLRNADRDLVSAWYWSAVDKQQQQVAAELGTTERRRDFIYSRSITTLVMQERTDRRPRAWVLERGEYDQRREEVTPGVPAMFVGLAPGVPANRLGLARWLVDRRHPLTARVTVNRLWQSVFGVGLVKTTEDFGAMGDRPTHPELLDWLAVEFVESDWDVRHMLKLMVNSAAYRQDSRATAAKRAADPDNRLLSRGPRHRLDAEVLRDQALVVGGLLQRRIGGPGVRPYQPKGVWKDVAFAGSNTREYQADSGTALYRRTLYTFWKRTSPPPSMAVFDAPTREQCTVRRERTNTPLQALVLMNDPQYVEAARGLAQQAVKRADVDAERARWMFRRALARAASDVDVEQLVAAAGVFRKQFTGDPKAADKLLGVGASPKPDGLDAIECASWTMVANLLMNRDDFLNVE